ncbi:unnamed protein product [Phytophthora lilii]|uniref:Unnamed protein product n=1 Tax=Phytophthora lilii TaxID=2077276 RepID=A0A9W6TBF4_9STRA|nr:unnamed protein product [Phytophthora lilii]
MSALSNLGVTPASGCSQTGARDMDSGADGAQCGGRSERPIRALYSPHSLICRLSLKCPHPRLHLTTTTMDACLQKFDTGMGSAPTTPTSAEATPRRVAHWDSKREKCNNCELIYLKTLSQHSGFCSVDCKSNMVYLQKVNRTIRAMKDAVDERQRLQEQDTREELPTQQEPQQPEVAQQPPAKLPPTENSPKGTAARSLTHSQSFAEFGLESRVVDASNVEWSFSAVY